MALLTKLGPLYYQILDEAKQLVLKQVTTADQSAIANNVRRIQQAVPIAVWLVERLVENNGGANAPPVVTGFISYVKTTINRPS
jgi:hypothetical protein